MKNFKNIISTSILLFVFNTNFAQTNFKHDIGVVLSTYDYNRIGIDYRVRINEKWKFKTGFIHGSRYSDYFGDSKIIGVSDSLVTERINYSRASVYTLKLGVERSLGTSLFSLTGDFLIGYKNALSTNKNQYTEYDSTGNWTQPVYMDYESYFGIADTTRAQINRHYFAPSIALGVMMDVPIKERFIFSLGISASIGTNFYLGASKEIDPYDEFHAPTGRTLDLNSFISAGLRYRFGGKDKSS